MGPCRTRVVFLLVLAGGLVVTTAHANDSAMGGRGGSLVPLRESRVVMVSEDIELRYDAGMWDVRAHYVFRNETDAPVALQMGFPETHCDGEGDCVMGEGDVFENMQTQVRGKPVPRRKGKLSREHAWAPKLGMVWLYDVEFAPSESLEIDHSYSAPSGRDVMGTEFTTYVTRTGALWGKPIERATFRVLLPPDTRQLHEPGLPRTNAERPEGPEGPLVLTYEARNWTPDDDFHIGFNERVDWHALEPSGPLKNLQCGELFSLYLVAESDDGREASDADLPGDSPTLRLCRNAVYAQYGRRFEDEALNQYFYGPEGFAPKGPAVLAFDPNPAYDDALLTPEDHRVLAMIVAREKRLQGDGVPADSALEDTGEEATALDPELAASTQAVTPSTTPVVSDEALASAQSEGGCGACTASATAHPAGWLLALGWLARRRRQPCG